jgi:hypothetical protein
VEREERGTEANLKIEVVASSMYWITFPFSSRHFYPPSSGSSET